MSDDRVTAPRGVMTVAVTGSTGLIGQAVCESLAASDKTVKRLVRKSPRHNWEVQWDPHLSKLDLSALSGLDAVIHLAGENIASGRWTTERMHSIRDSRVNPTRLLSETLAKLSRPPRVLIAASAVGFYGDTGKLLVDENSPKGRSFLADVCEAWEAATAPAAQAGIRVVNLRLGMVLSRHGGALSKMLLPFSLGAGGTIGDGKQLLSWITLEDVVGLINYALVSSDLSGPVNAVTPNVVTNYEFTKTLGRLLKRPTIAPLPAPVARLILGRMADELLLSSSNVRPSKLLHRGYKFAYPTIDGALSHLLSC